MRGFVETVSAESPAFGGCAGGTDGEDESQQPQNSKPMMNSTRGRFFTRRFPVLMDDPLILARSLEKVNLRGRS